MLLADEKGATLIVAVGTHATLVEFLDKGRGGMASTFLTRLRLGGKLVDAKGVSRLYRSRISTAALVILVLAALRRRSAPPSPCPRPAGSTSTCCSTNGTASCSGWRTSSRDRLPLPPGLADRRLPGGRAGDRHRHHRAQRADPRRHRGPGRRPRAGQARRWRTGPSSCRPSWTPPTRFDEAVAPALVDGTLAGRSVLLVVANEDVDPETVEERHRADRRGRRHASPARSRCRRSTATRPPTRSLQSYVTGGGPARRASQLPETDDAGRAASASLLAQVLMIPAGAGAGARQRRHLLGARRPGGARRAAARTATRSPPADYAVVLTAGALHRRRRRRAQRAPWSSSSPPWTPPAPAPSSPATPPPRGENGLVGVDPRRPDRLGRGLHRRQRRAPPAGRISTVLAARRRGRGHLGQVRHRARTPSRCRRCPPPRRDAPPARGAGLAAGAVPRPRGPRWPAPPRSTARPGRRALAPDELRRPAGHPARRTGPGRGRHRHRGRSAPPPGSRAAAAVVGTVSGARRRLRRPGRRAARAGPGQGPGRAPRARCARAGSPPARSRSPASAPPPRSPRVLTRPAAAAPARWSTACSPPAWSPAPRTWSTCSTCAPAARARPACSPPRPTLGGPAGGLVAGPLGRHPRRAARRPGRAGHARRRGRQRPRRAARPAAGRGARPRAAGPACSPASSR